MRKILLLIVLTLAFFTSCDNIVPIASIDPYKKTAKENYYADPLTGLNGNDFPKTDAEGFKILLISDTHFGKTKSGTFFKTEDFEKYIKDSGILSSSDFIVNLGDVSDNSEQAQLDEYKEWSENLFAGKPIVNVIGNHDNRNGGVQRFIDTFDMDSTYYRFNASDVQFYVVDSAFRTLGRQQLDHLMKVLEENKDEKKIILTHIPLYGSITNFYASFADEKERNFLLSRFSRYGVNLLLTGHKHVPESYYDYTDSFTEIVVNGFHGESFRGSVPAFYVCEYKKADSSFTIDAYFYKDDTFSKTNSHTYTL
ncbi:MAG: metallophosphoesterase [Bullifex sp.]|nr:metallophosphoesterase [Spirochaetales bacterium]MDD7537265.1 metallophosphoesterase [Spirochaetales bacterium]MDY5776234.1 metallophosphoesterase [Bullifex sp.]MDY5909144.1 metallophosphoesterase [Bullifex sp.]